MENKIVKSNEVEVEVAKSKNESNDSLYRMTDEERRAQEERQKRHKRERQAKTRARRRVRGC